MKFSLVLVWASIGFLMSCGSPHQKNPTQTFPPDVELEFEELEKLKSLKHHRPVRWKKWKRTIHPARQRPRRRPPRQRRPRPSSPAPSQLKIEIDQNIEWYCIKHRKSPRNCLRQTEPILNRCTRQNGNQLNRKVVNCIKKKLKLKR